MTNAILTKLKIATKRLLGKCVYSCVYLKNTIRSLHTLPATNPDKGKRRHKNNLFNFIALFTERWRFFTVVLCCILLLYYGIGAAVSSKINKPLDAKLVVSETSPRHTTAALIYVLKSQVDDSPWTPALPAIFPAAVLDNLPNFQLGAKDGVKYLVKRLSGYHVDANLKEAGELLNYPADIWLFSQTGEDRLAPGSAKQYRKALAKLSEFAASPNNKKALSSNEFLYILSGLENLINRQLNTLHKHVLEHNSETLDFKADDLFFQTSGNIYAVYYLLQGLAKDFQDMIVETGEYENVTAAQSFLTEALNLSPASIKNASPREAFGANHLLYLGYCLSRAQNYLQTVHHNIDIKTRKQSQ